MKKAFAPEQTMQGQGGWSGVEAYYCSGCDQILVAVGFTQHDRDVFFVPRDAIRGFSIPASPAARNHWCYQTKALAAAVQTSELGFENLRSVRAQIGARRRPDDPRLTLELIASEAASAAIRETLHQWLVNSQSGEISAEETTPEGNLLHISLTNPPRVGQMVERMIRKFGLMGKVRFYRYNEGRRYITDRL